MTDYLADARACIQAAAQAPHPDTRISWLTVICEQIISHLESQQASPQPATAPPAALRARANRIEQGGQP